MHTYMRTWLRHDVGMFLHSTAAHIRFHSQCSARMCVCIYVHCIARVQPGSQAQHRGSSSGSSTAPVRFGLPIIAAILCHLHRLATPAAPSNDVMPKSQISPVIILCRQNLLRPFVHFILVFYFAVCSLFEKYSEKRELFNSPDCLFSLCLVRCICVRGSFSVSVCVCVRVMQIFHLPGMSSSAL